MSDKQKGMTDKEALDYMLARGLPVVEMFSKARTESVSERAALYAKIIIGAHHGEDEDTRLQMITGLVGACFGLLEGAYNFNPRDQKVSSRVKGAS